MPGPQRPHGLQPTTEAGFLLIPFFHSPAARPAHTLLINPIGFYLHLLYGTLVLATGLEGKGLGGTIRDGDFLV